MQDVTPERLLKNPFTTASSFRNSDYSAYVDGHLVHMLDARPVSVRAGFVHRALRSLITSSKYPCVGAKSVLNRATYRFGCYGTLASESASAGLARDLCAFVAEMCSESERFCSYIAVFADDSKGYPVPFERALWQQLSELRSLDEKFFEYDQSVSSDPENPRYAFSFAACAMFVVGLHPAATRRARQFPWPALVFNPHHQFRLLKASKKYVTFKRVIRSREMALQGSLNPNLRDFGEQSEARQYSGDAVKETWKCPFGR